MSSKPVAERLQVKKGRTLAVVGDSGEVSDLVGAHHARTRLDTADVVLLVTPDRIAFDRDVPHVLSAMRDTAVLWVAYPKAASKRASDIRRAVIHAKAPEHGLDTVSQIAIDDTWSALRLKRV